MSIVSYAQNYEDVLLWRALQHVADGRYVDIGAQAPLVDSVSQAFYSAGWRGIHVEATPAFAKALRQARPDEIVIEAAVTDASSPFVLYEIPETGLSTGIKAIAEQHRGLGFAVRPIEVSTITLKAVLDEYGRGDIHWMKIDVEGMEASVLRSWGNSPLRPWILVIESTCPNTQIQTQGEWIDLVQDKGYHEVYFDGLSRYFVSDAHAELDVAFTASPNLFDDFSVTSKHFSARVLNADHCQREDKLKQQLNGADDAIRVLETELAEARNEATAVTQELLAAEQERNSALAAMHMEQMAAAFEFAASREALLAEQVHESSNALSLSCAALDEANARLAAHTASWEIHQSNLEQELSASQTQLKALHDELDALRAASAHHTQEATWRDARLATADELIAAIKRQHSQPLTALANRLGALFDLRPAQDVANAQEQWAAHPQPAAAPIPSFAPGPSLMSMANEIEKNPYLRADSLAELCAFHDLDFVRCAYVTLLGRQPDPVGEAYYAGRLRAGWAKLEIIRQLRRSGEGQLHDPGIAGLDRALRKHHHAMIPIVGWFVRLVTGREGNSLVERRLRSLENEVGLIRCDMREERAQARKFQEKLNSNKTAQKRIVSVEEILDICA